MPAARKPHGATRLDRELAHLPKTLDEDVVHAHALFERDDDLEAARMEPKRLRLFRARMQHFVLLELVVPHAHGLVSAAGRNDRSLDARVDLDDAADLVALRQNAS